MFKTGLSSLWLSGKRAAKFWLKLKQVTLVFSTFKLTIVHLLSKSADNDNVIMTMKNIFSGKVIHNATNI